ncbi:glycosyltransferase family 2 protein [Aquibium sp. ELW1220]|uniref:glycosyltransferase family 2 protein n=1 Tax=Aquibium sp. ELW1220 TaxID=2976766 RepID=UPI0025B04163|nr:glycosyltransferase family 2 protein [Aquibium sp. ELW1220]MDN2580163.1 glycosyltransferase family 92 protein [Aquibium sp. ELW1220]
MPRVAAITMAFNEPEFLPLWLEHYGRMVGHDNLYVVSFADRVQRADSSRRHQLIDLPDVDFDEVKRAAMMSSLQSMLLQSYDWVVMSDADELIVPDSARYAGLADYLRAKADEPYFNVVGFNVVQDRRHEPALDARKPLLRQRSWVRFDAVYCKPLLSRVPLIWGPGFHACDRPRRQTDDLFMFHLRAADETVARTRSARLKRLRMSQSDVKAGHSRHFSLHVDEYLAHVFPDPGEFATAMDGFDPAPDIDHLRRVPEDFHYRGRLCRLPPRFADVIAPAPSRPGRLRHRLGRFFGSGT